MKKKLDKENKSLYNAVEGTNQMPMGDYILKQKTIRDKEYISWIKELPCLICYSPSEPHHLALKGQKGMGVKVSDRNCVPFCNNHHRMFHQIGRDTFAKQFNLDYEYIIERLNKIWHGLNSTSRH
jgi:hypothetical protein